MVFEYSRSHPSRLCMHVGVMIGTFGEISVACSTISTWPTVGYKNLNHEFFPLKKKFLKHLLFYLCLRMLILYM